METVQHHLLETVTGIVLLLLVAALTTIASKRLNKMPLTILLVFVGIIISNFGGEISVFESLRGFKITPELVLFVFIPTLIFESAYNLDVKKVSRNIGPILTLAVPGLLISTAIIGSIFYAFTDGFSFLVCLLLGAILSATDPVAVISIFKQLGVPERLTVLVEGESLFNDATALVLATIMSGLVISGVFSSEVLANGASEFLFVFLGGVMVGLFFAYVTGLLIGLVDDDPDVEITLTTILAYFSFIVAEHVFHVSGIMAVVAAAMVMGSWGKSKVSPSSAGFMEHFWEYLAFVANSLIFLLVGLQIDLIALWQSLDLILLVAFAMLIARGLVVFLGVPLVGKIPGSEAIGMPFKMVMYWGGLRGAIALAIVLSLPEFDYRDTLVTIVMGAVLFTLIVQGLTIELLVKYLGLDALGKGDLVAKLEGTKQARRAGESTLKELVSGGYFSERVAENMENQLSNDLTDLNREIEHLENELSKTESISILSLRSLAREKTEVYDLFSKGLIDEWSFRELDGCIELQIDRVRYQNELPSPNIPRSVTRLLDDVVTNLITLFGLKGLGESRATSRVVRDYTVSWGRYRSASAVLNEFEKISGRSSNSSDAKDSVRNMYSSLRDEIQKEIEEVAIQYPEFIEAVQEQLGQRLVLIAENESIRSASKLGLLKPGIASKIGDEHREKLKEIKHNDLSKTLKIEADELIKKVPMFSQLAEKERDQLANLLRARTIRRGESIIREGEKGDSLFLIARGIAKVERTHNGEMERLATLYAGDFFGEGALLRGEPRNASAVAATPCSLYELTRSDLEQLFEKQPSIKEQIISIDQER